jgi:hypothetical protein
VHVDGERRRRGVVREPPLLARHLRERHPAAAELARHGEEQVARVAQVLEVLGEERVLLVVARRALVAADEDLVGEHGVGLDGDGGHGGLRVSGSRAS